MDRMKNFNRETKFSQPIAIGLVSITAQSELIRIKRPLCHIIWHRPIAILVEQDGQAQSVPIWDVTRLLHSGLLISTFIFTVIRIVHSYQKGRKSNESTTP